MADLYSLPEIFACAEFRLQLQGRDGCLYGCVASINSVVFKDNVKKTFKITKTKTKTICIKTTTLPLHAQHVFVPEPKRKNDRIDAKTFNKIQKIIKICT